MTSGILVPPGKLLEWQISEDCSRTNWILFLETWSWGICPSVKQLPTSSLLVTREKGNLCCLRHCKACSFLLFATESILNSYVGIVRVLIRESGKGVQSGECYQKPPRRKGADGRPSQVLPRFPVLTSSSFLLPSPHPADLLWSPWEALGCGCPASPRVSLVLCFCMCFVP